MICPFCGKTFRRLCNLKTHVKRYHLDGVRVCPVCGQDYKTSRGLLMHAVFRKDGCAQHATLFYLMRSSYCDKPAVRKAYELLKSGRFRVLPEFGLHS